MFQTVDSITQTFEILLVFRVKVILNFGIRKPQNGYYTHAQQSKIGAMPFDMRIAFGFGQCNLNALINKRHYMLGYTTSCCMEILASNANQTNRKDIFNGSLRFFCTMRAYSVCMFHKGKQRPDRDADT